MKHIKAVQPYIHSGHLNFKLPVFNAWKNSGGQIADSHYPFRILHGLAYKYELPNLKWLNTQNSRHEAYLMFVEPVSLSFDTFPYYATHEVIPMFWDCWPRHYNKVERWIRKHKIKTAIFTSTQEMNEIKKRIPELSVLHCPEAVDTKQYCEGFSLKDRDIDILEFGRSNTKVIDNRILKQSLLNGKKINHVTTRVNGKYVFSNEELQNAMQNAKITICLPKNMTHPELAGDVETLTQRYWEAMLSRMVIVGHAPKELVDLIGYNPVIELSFSDNTSIQEQIFDILKNITHYQNLVDKNREAAIRLGDWRYRIEFIKKWLRHIGYKWQID